MKATKLTEAEFTRQVLQTARLFGWRSAHFRAVRVQRKGGSVYHETPVQGDGKGFPDLVLVRGDDMLVAELKVGKNKATAEQATWLTAFAEAGIPAYVWRPELWSEVEAVLRDGPKPCFSLGRFRRG